MKLSTKSRYAIMAMAELAREHTPDKSTPVATIAELQDLPLPYLEQIFSKLRRSNLIKSERGPMGGYSLTRTPKDIRVYDIILATDAPVKVTRCTSTSAGGCKGDGNRCHTHNLWHDLEYVIQDFLSQLTLQDVVNGNRTYPLLSLHREAPSPKKVSVCT